MKKPIDIVYASELIKKLGMYRTAKIFGVHVKTLATRLKENNIQSVHYFNIPKFNDSFFEVIDSEEKAYWLGFMFADGFISKRKDKKSFIVAIELQAKDKIHLEKFKESIGYKNKLYYNKRSYTETWKISINSKKMFDDLASHGCVERKSLILDWPKEVPDNLIHHFIRGYFDGDGSIFKGQSITSWGINFVSSKIFLSKLKIFFETLGISCKKLVNKKNDKSAMLVYDSKSDINIILDLMYKNSNIYLERKHKLYKESEFDRTRNMVHKNVDTKLALEELKTKSLAYVSEKFKVNSITLKKYFKRDGLYGQYEQNVSYKIKERLWMKKRNKQEKIQCQ